MASKMDTAAKVGSVGSQLDTHVAVCAERYEEINYRLRRLERIVMGTAGTIIVLLCGLVLRG
mgnify:CR=1 FL=1|jgi:hypothetical protein